MFVNQGQNEFLLEFSLHSLLNSIPHDRYILKVALPEGAQIVKEDFIGISPKRSKDELTYSYLNYFGRPTRVYYFDNYLGQPNPGAKLVIAYKFRPSSIFIAPLYLISALSVAFILYIILSRLDLNFGMSEDSAAEPSQGAKAKQE